MSAVTTLPSDPDSSIKAYISTSKVNSDPPNTADLMLCYYEKKNLYIVKLAIGHGEIGGNDISFGETSAEVALPLVVQVPFTSECLVVKSRRQATAGTAWK